MWLCVTFKFVCFYGIKGKKHVDEVGSEIERERERERERESSGMFWSLEEVVGKKKERVRVRVWRRKKERKKEEGNMDEKNKEMRENKIKNKKLKLRNAITIFL